MAQFSVTMPDPLRGHHAFHRGGGRDGPPLRVARVSVEHADGCAECIPQRHASLDILALGERADR